MSQRLSSDLAAAPGLQTIAAREAVLLAPHALRSSDSRGRRFPEAEHPYRGPYQRDRDRILHSAAFRRLSGKMQVFTGDMGDYHRTRLTHTQEVASIARTIGRALKLNEDFIEALALLHDIGHPPYGHAGEDALDACLASEGGFSHNRFALTLAEELENRYPGFPGLNLTREVLEGQATRADKALSHETPPLEVQVVDLADSITYDAHDTDDAVKLGLVTLAELEQLALIRETVGNVRQRFGPLKDKPLRKAVVHELIDWQVSDVLLGRGLELTRAGFTSSGAARQACFRLAPTATMAAQKRELEAFLQTRVYRHPRLVAVRTEAQVRIRAMFAALVARPEQLPEKFRERSHHVGLRRAIGDYLGGMTDRYCEQQYERLGGAIDRMG